jgi:hypothetical protein
MSHRILETVTVRTERTTEPAHPFDPPARTIEETVTRTEHLVVETITGDIGIVAVVQETKPTQVFIEQSASPFPCPSSLGMIQRAMAAKINHDFMFAAGGVMPHTRPALVGEYFPDREARLLPSAVRGGHDDEPPACLPQVKNVPPSSRGGGGAAILPPQRDEAEIVKADIAREEAARDRETGRELVLSGPIRIVGVPPQIDGGRTYG